MIGLLPRVAGAWLELRLLDRRRNGLPTLSDVRQLTGGDCLDHDIAQGRGFNGTGNDNAMGGVGGKLAQQPVYATAAHNPNRLQAAPRQLFERFQHRPVP